MAPNLALNAILFCVIALSGVFAGLAIAGFGNPEAFIRWLSPVHYLTQKISGASFSPLDRTISYTIAFVSLALLTFCSFLLGGWMTTAFLGLWNSPFSPFVMP